MPVHRCLSDVAISRRRWARIVWIVGRHRSRFIVSWTVFIPDRYEIAQIIDVVGEVSQARITVRDQDVDQMRALAPQSANVLEATNQSFRRIFDYSELDPDICHIGPLWEGMK